MVGGGVVEPIARGERAAGEVERGGRKEGQKVFRFPVQRTLFSAVELREVEVVLHGSVDEVDLRQLRFFMQTARNAEVEQNLRALFQNRARADCGVHLAHAADAEQNVLSERLARVHGLAVYGENVFDFHLIKERFRLRIHCNDCADHIAVSFILFHLFFHLYYNSKTRKTDILQRLRRSAFFRGKKRFFLYYDVQKPLQASFFTCIITILHPICNQMNKPFHLGNKKCRR